MRPLMAEESTAARLRLNHPRREEDAPEVQEGVKPPWHDPQGDTAQKTDEVLVVGELLRRVGGRGTDVRLDIRSCHRAKVWPREALNVRRWKWGVVQEIDGARRGTSTC